MNPVHLTDGQLLPIVGGVCIFAGACIGLWVGLMIGLASRESCEPVSAEEFRKGACL